MKTFETNYIGVEINKLRESDTFLKEDGTTMTFKKRKGAHYMVGSPYLIEEDEKGMCSITFNKGGNRLGHEESNSYLRKSNANSDFISRQKSQLREQTNYLYQMKLPEIEQAFGASRYNGKSESLKQFLLSKI